MARLNGGDSLNKLLIKTPTPPSNPPPPFTEQKSGASERALMKSVAPVKLSAAQRKSSKQEESGVLNAPCETSPSLSNFESAICLNERRLKQRVGEAPPSPKF